MTAGDGEQERNGGNRDAKLGLLTRNSGRGERAEDTPPLSAPPVTGESVK